MNSAARLPKKPATDLHGCGVVLRADAHLTPLNINWCSSDIGVAQSSFCSIESQAIEASLPCIQYMFRNLAWKGVDRMKRDTRNTVLKALLGAGMYLLDPLRDRLADRLDDISDRARDTYENASDRFSDISDRLR